MRPVLISAIALLAMACSPPSAETADQTTSPSRGSTTSGTSDATTSPPDASTTSEMAGAYSEESTTTATSIQPSTITTSLPAFPAQKESFEHGGEAWAVYLAVADEFDAPRLGDAVSIAEHHGYWAATGDLGCDAGGAEATGVEPAGTWVAVGVYFNSEGDAMDFVNALVARGHPVVGFGAVQTYCLD